MLAARHDDDDDNERKKKSKKKKDHSQHILPDNFLVVSRRCLWMIFTQPCLAQGHKDDAPSENETHKPSSVSQAC